MTPRKKVGLVLGSGGARGWAHIGVIKALHAMGFKPDVIAGSSIGALIGAIYASGAMEAFVKEVEAFDFPKLAKLFAEVRFPRAGLLSGKPILKWLAKKSLLGNKTFDDLEIPFAVIATDLFKEESVVLRSGSLIDAVRASIAIPGIFDPVMCNQRILVDGGLSDPIPVSVARQLGADIVIAVDINVQQKLLDPQQVPTIFMTLLQTSRIFENQMTRLTLAHYPADILIKPDIGHIQSLDFYGGKEAIRKGELAVEQIRPQLLKALES
ncbi:MAG: patatin-like phospholipase family protein [Kiritimatiellia bacterium]